jgi:hypothetical protein
MTAKDLLHKLLDYGYLWSSPDRIYSLPATTRLAQIEALQEAFGLSKKYVNPLKQVKYFFSGSKQGMSRSIHLQGMSNLQYLLHGEFLNDREPEANSKLAGIALATIDMLVPDLPENIKERPVDIGWMYNNLLLFRKKVYEMTYPSSGMLEGFSVGLQYSHYLQAQLRQVIIDNLEAIDDTLWLILDPPQRDIDEKEFNYPHADLEAIDLEWRINSY